MPKLMSSQQLPSRSCVITTKDSLFCKMFPPLFCFEQVKTLKNFSGKLFISKIKKKEEEEETKSSVWDFKTPKLAQIHQHSSGSRPVCLSVRPIIKAHFQIWEEHFGFWEILGENSEKIRKVSLLEQITQLTHAPSIRTERKYTKSQPLSLSLLSGAKLFGHASHSIPTKATPCLACQQFDFNSADWFSDSQHVSSTDICEQWERNLTACFRRRLWGRNTWRTPKNVCEEGKFRVRVTRVLLYSLFPIPWSTLLLN